ncbi:hypothetical protein ACFLXL_01225 [Chloroflexota bacterium]
MIGKNSQIAVVVLLVFALISVVMGVVFISQGISKDALLTQAMVAEKVSYTSEEAKGAIKDVIDTPEEAEVMAEILREHRTNNYGYYTELKRDDPNRDQILKAITMENSLNMAQLGFGLTAVVKVTGVFMIVMGLALGTVAFGIRPRS